MIRAVIFDLDNCLSAADEPGEALLAPVFDAIRRTNHGTLSEEALDRAFADCWYHALDFVARKHGFTDEMLAAGWAVYATTEVRAPMRGYGDLAVLADLRTQRFLVTSGFRRLQESKVEALGIGHLFAEIRIDAIDDKDRIGKQAIFVELCDAHGLRPDEVLVVGDNDESELEAGRQLGMETVQVLRPGVVRSENVTHHVHRLEEITPIVERGRRRPRSDAEEIGVGLVGYGMAGRIFHAPLIESVRGLTLRAVVERSSARSAERYPGVKIVADIDALLEDPDVELVVIATPALSHFDLARRALLADRHVVVEKPFTPSSKEAQQLIDLARERGLVLTVFQNRRWDGDFRTVRTVVEGGVLGRLVELESHFDRFRPAVRPGAWKEGVGEASGVLFDLGPHLVDQALLLFGMPNTVTADLRLQRDAAAAVDRFEVRLDYDELRVTLAAGMLVRERGPRFVLHGTRGSFVKFGMDPQEEALGALRTPAEVGWGVESRDAWGTLNTEVGGLHVVGQVETLPGCYQVFYENVRDAIARDAALAVRPDDARDTIRILELAVESHAQRRTIAWEPV